MGAADELSNRKEIRTITTSRGTVFRIFGESARYIICREPATSDTPQDALHDFDWMADNGYFLANHYAGFGGFVVFEKRGIK